MNINYIAPKQTPCDGAVWVVCASLLSVQQRCEGR